jgi:hypothetical protein
MQEGDDNMNLYDILSLKFTNADFRKDIKLADEGNGPFIQEWNIDEEMPTQEQLDKWEKEVDLAYRQRCARESRIYPLINEQLDMMYHDKMDGTNLWCDTITKIKDECPIPIK